MSYRRAHAIHRSRRPHARRNWLIAVGLLAVGYAIYLRYMIVENVPVGLACDAGQQTWLCLSRKIAGTLDNNGAFGWIALIFARRGFHPARRGAAVGGAGDDGARAGDAQCRTGRHRRRTYRA